MAIYIRIKELAKERGLGMATLARRADLSPLTVQQLMRHPTTPCKLVTLDRLSKALGVPAEELITSIPDPEATSVQPPSSEPERMITTFSAHITRQPDEQMNSQRQPKYLVQSQRISVLPRNLPKVHRLDFQHHLLRAIIGSNYRAPIDPAATHILDVAGGTGRWAHEMARAFPFAQVVALDEEAPPEYGQPAPPPNAHFVQHDLFTRLPFPDQSFDFVHQRFLALVLPAREWSQMLAELLRVTRQGSWVELVEGGGSFLNAGAATLQLMQWWDRAAQPYGIDLSLMQQLAARVQQAGLHGVQQQRYRVPLGHWGGRMGEKAKINLLTGLAGIKNFVCMQAEVAPEDFEAVLAKLPEEWERQQTVYEYALAYGQR